MLKNVHQKYALIGVIWIMGLHILFYLGDVAALGFYLGDLIALALRMLPLVAIFGVFFYGTSFVKGKALRVILMFFLLIISFLAVVYWPW